MEDSSEVERLKCGRRPMPKVLLPPYTAPGPAALANRRKLGEEARRLREAVGPLGFSLTDLLRQDRESH